MSLHIQEATSLSSPHKLAGWLVIAVMNCLYGCDKQRHFILDNEQHCIKSIKTVGAPE